MKPTVSFHRGVYDWHDEGDDGGPHGLRLIIDASGPRSALAHAIREWADEQAAGDLVRKGRFDVWPNDPGSGHREFVVAWDAD